MSNVTDVVASVEAANDIDVSGRPEPLAPDNPSPGALPKGWNTDVKEIPYKARTSDAFGADIVGEDVGAPVEEAKTDDKPRDESGKFQAKPKDKPAEKTEETVTEEVTEESTEVEAKDDAEETTEEVEVKEEKPVEEKPSALRRKALDALKLEAQRREVTQKLQDTQRQLEAERLAREAEGKKLREGTIEERLTALGLDPNEIFEKLVKGEIKELPKAEPQQDPVVAELKKQLDEIRQRDAAREAETARLREAASVANAIKHLSSDGHSYPFVLATPGAVPGVIESAGELWKAAGAVPGTEIKYLYKAAEAAEEYFAEQAEPIIKAHAARTGKKAAVEPKKDGPVAEKPAAPAKKLAVSGKKLASPRVDDQDGPESLSATAWGQRDNWVKEEMRKSGKGSW